MASSPSTINTLLLVVLILVWGARYAYLQQLGGEEFQKVLTTLANDNLGANQFQDFLDRQVEFSESPLDGADLVQTVAEALSSKFQKRIEVVESLHELIQNEYTNFNANNGFPACCTGRLNEQDHRFKALVNLDDVCTAGQHADSATKFVTAKIRDTMRENLRNNPTLKWQYFGSEEGVMTTYPSFRLCSPQYDPRFRPWYVSSATPKPKDVVLVIDTSGSMTGTTHGKSKLQVAILAASTVIETLSPSDRIGVISFGDEPQTPPGNKETDTCYSTMLAKATPQNQAYLKKYVTYLVAAGQTYYGKAFKKAFDLMASAGSQDSDKHGRDKVILFLTDGLPTDEISPIVSTISTENAKLNNLVVILTYGIGDALEANSTEILKTIAEQSDHDPDAGEIKRGKFTPVEDISNLRQVMGSYYVFFGKTGQEPKPSYVIPYYDAFGLGLVTSACMPVYYSTELVGVVCVDITVSDLLSDVTHFKEGELSYAFMIDEQARLRIHPLLPQPYAVEEDPIFVDMLSLETFPGAKDMLESMLRREIGEERVASSKRVKSRGDARYEGVDVSTQKTTYYWQPVVNTEFSVCLAIGDADKRSVIKWNDDFDQQFAYHRLDLKRPEFSEVCNYYGRLSLKDHSTVQFSPDAFFDPYLYLSTQETSTTIERYELYMIGRLNLPSQNPGFKDGLRETVSSTAYFNRLWKDLKQSDYVIWRYIGTENGIFQVMPGSSLEKDYDHTRRPWYQRAVSQKGQTVLSTPYEDLLGAGYVVTLSKTIFEGSSSLVHSPSDTVFGVLSMDFTLGYVYNLLRDTFSECRDPEKSCFIMEISGFMVVHGDFVASHANTKPKLDNVHIIEKEPNIASDLINQKIMTREGCINFETLREQYFWTVSIKFGTSYVTQDYELYEVPDTNLFLGILKRPVREVTRCHCFSGDVTGKDVLGECYNADCVCPCSVATDIYDYCGDTFQLSLDSLPPCTPRVVASQGSSTNPEELKQASSLRRCFSYGCTSIKDNRECMNTATCSWCLFNNEGRSLPNPFCETHGNCTDGSLDNGGMGKSTTSKSGDDADNDADNDDDSSDDSMTVIIIAAVVGTIVLIIVGVLALVIYRSFKPGRSSSRPSAPSANATQSRRNVTSPFEDPPNNYERVQIRQLGGYENPVSGSDVTY